MQNIAFYLQKYSKVGFKQENFKKILIETIKEICDLEITHKQIKISSQTIFVSAVSVAKSEIFLNRNKINETLNRKLEDAGSKVQNKNII